MPHLRLALLVIASALWTGLSWAGTLTVRDAPGFLPQDELRALTREASEWPFQVHVLIENAGSTDALENDAHAWVDGPNVVVLAVDPGSHHTVARFGTATGVKPGDYDAIAKAGNAHFRAHEVGPGLSAMVTRAKASAQATTALSGATEPIIIERGLSTGHWIGIGFLVASFAGLAIWLVRKHKRERDEYLTALNENREETAELRSRNIDFMTRPSPPARSGSRIRSAPLPAPNPYAPVVPGAAPVIVNQGSSNDLLTGVLVGEALSRPRERDIVVEREVVREPAPASHHRSSDDGGSSSSWSGGSSSWDSGSSSSDSGGSSSSWDSGSSGWGSGSGGGFDSGGGGSSW